MFAKLREKSKNKKGFTLVELIVVLVILAILIAMLVPALTGYIDKANEKKVMAEAKLALVAVQSVEGDEYAKTTEYTAVTDGEVKEDAAENTKEKEILDLSEVAGFTTFTYKTNEKGKVIELVYTKGGTTCTYKGATKGTDGKHVDATWETK